MKIDNQAMGFMRTVMACATQICGVVAIKYRFIRFIVYVSRALASVPDHLERLDLLWLIRRSKGRPPLSAFWPGLLPKKCCGPMGQIRLPRCIGSPRPHQVRDQTRP